MEATAVSRVSGAGALRARARRITAAADMRAADEHLLAIAEHAATAHELGVLERRHLDALVKATHDRDHARAAYLEEACAIISD